MRAGSIVAVGFGVDEATTRGVAEAEGGVVAVGGMGVQVGYGVDVGVASTIWITTSTDRRPLVLSVVMIQVPCFSSAGNVMARTVRPSEFVSGNRSIACVFV